MGEGLFGGAGPNAPVPVSKGLTGEWVTSVLIFIPWHPDSARLLTGLCAHWLLAGSTVSRLFFFFN